MIDETRQEPSIRARYSDNNAVVFFISTDQMPAPMVLPRKRTLAYGIDLQACAGLSDEVMISRSFRTRVSYMGFAYKRSLGATQVAELQTVLYMQISRCTGRGMTEARRLII